MQYNADDFSNKSKTHKHSLKAVPIILLHSIIMIRLHNNKVPPLKNIFEFCDDGFVIITARLRFNLYYSRDFIWKFLKMTFWLVQLGNPISYFCVIFFYFLSIKMLRRFNETRILYTFSFAIIILTVRFQIINNKCIIKYICITILFKFWS